jgi:hypothetical protein
MVLSLSLTEWSFNMTFDEACHYLWREELTDWGEYKVPNHVYITKGTDLVGYVPYGTKDVKIFSAPKKSWSVSRRKFRKFNKKDIKYYFENK